MKNSQEFMKIHKNSLVMIFFHATESKLKFYQGRRNISSISYPGLWHTVDTTWAQSFKTEELLINVPALGAKEKII